MKNIFKYFALSITFYSLNAQTIINMADNNMPINYTKNGTYYLKDINNYMLPFLGTWSYINGNKEFKITLSKVTKFHVIFSDYNINYYRDGILIQYQKYENGVLVYNSLTNDYPTGLIQEFGLLEMSFTDYQRNEETFPLTLTLLPLNVIGQTPQYNLKFELDKFERRNTYYDQHPNEPYFSVPDGIIMTKVP